MPHLPIARRRLQAVIIYTTAWCPYCAKLRTSLTASGILTWSMMSRIPARSAWLLTLRGPASGIGDRREVIYGYDVARIAFALRDLGYSFIPVSDQKPANKRNRRDQFAVGGSK